MVESFISLICFNSLMVLYSLLLVLCNLDLVCIRSSLMTALGSSIFDVFISLSPEKGRSESLSLLTLSLSLLTLLDMVSTELSKLMVIWLGLTLALFKWLLSPINGWDVVFTTVFGLNSGPSALSQSGWLYAACDSKEATWTTGTSAIGGSLEDSPLMIMSWRQNAHF